jgi:hypothetical protein
LIDAEMEKKDRANEKEIAALDEKKAKGLISEEDYTKKKAELDKKAAKEKAILERKQAVLQRSQALFNIAIDTAQNVVKLIGTGPLAPVLIALAIATGALSAATVLAKPLPEIPKFARGGIAIDGRGIFGEAGTELMRTNSGQLHLADKATYFEGNEFKGAKIWNSKETDFILNQTKHTGFEHSTFSNEKSLSSLARIEQAIKDKPVLLFDKNTNQPVGYSTNRNTTRILDRYKYGS